MTMASAGVGRAVARAPPPLPPVPKAPPSHRPDYAPTTKKRIDAFDALVGTPANGTEFMQLVMLDALAVDFAYFTASLNLESDSADAVESKHIPRHVLDVLSHRGRELVAFVERKGARLPADADADKFALYSATVGDACLLWQYLSRDPSAHGNLQLYALLNGAFTKPAEYGKFAEALKHEAKGYTAFRNALRVACGCLIAATVDIWAPKYDIGDAMRHEIVAYLQTSIREHGLSTQMALCALISEVTCCSMESLSLWADVLFAFVPPSHSHVSRFPYDVLTNSKTHQAVPVATYNTEERKRLANTTLLFGGFEGNTPHAVLTAASDDVRRFTGQARTLTLNHASINVRTIQSVLYLSEEAALNYAGTNGLRRRGFGRGGYLDLIPPAPTAPVLFAFARQTRLTSRAPKQSGLNDPDAKSAPAPAPSAAAAVIVPPAAAAAVVVPPAVAAAGGSGPGAGTAVGGNGARAGAGAGAGGAGPGAGGAVASANRGRAKTPRGAAAPAAAAAAGPSVPAAVAAPPAAASADFKHVSTPNPVQSPWTPPAIPIRKEDMKLARGPSVKTLAHPVVIQRAKAIVGRSPSAPVTTISNIQWMMADQGAMPWTPATAPGDPFIKQLELARNTKPVQQIGVVRMGPRFSTDYGVLLQAIEAMLSLISREKDVKVSEDIQEAVDAVRVVCTALQAFESRSGFDAKLHTYKVWVTLSDPIRQAVRVRAMWPQTITGADAFEKLKNRIAFLKSDPARPAGGLGQWKWYRLRRLLGVYTVFEKSNGPGNQLMAVPIGVPRVSTEAASGQQLTVNAILAGEYDFLYSEELGKDTKRLAALNIDMFRDDDFSDESVVATETDNATWTLYPPSTAGQIEFITRARCVFGLRSIRRLVFGSKNEEGQDYSVILGPAVDSVSAATEAEVKDAKLAADAYTACVRFVQYFETHPTLFSADTATAIKALKAETPKEFAAVLDAVRRALFPGAAAGK